VLGLFKKRFDMEAFIAGSLEGLKMTTEAHRGTWHLGEEKSWSVDQDSGRIASEARAWGYTALAMRLAKAPRA
jgi:hypothetical protein